MRWPQFFAGAIALIASALAPSFQLEMAIASSQGGTLRAYYDVGEGIKERNFAGVSLQGRPGTLYYFALPADYRAIHFTQVDRDDAEIVIHSIRLGIRAREHRCCARCLSRCNGWR